MLGVKPVAVSLASLALATVLSLGGCAMPTWLGGSGSEPAAGNATVAKTEPAAPDTNATARQESDIQERPITDTAPAESPESSPATPAASDQTQQPAPTPEAEKTEPASTPPAAPAQAAAPDTASAQPTPQSTSTGTTGTTTGDVAALEASKVPQPGSPQTAVYYRTDHELLKAVQVAIEKEKFLGYTDPFDAFPILPGNDTISAAFVPVDHPEYKVFYHAFYTPDRPFHKRVYGYTVIDTRTNKDYGYFDGNADGVFEQNTLNPKIVLDDYQKKTEKQPAPTAP